MTYREFGEKYLTPPERERYFNNVLKEDDMFVLHIKSIDEHKPRRKCFFCDTFRFSESAEGFMYWNSIELKILKTFDTTM